MLKEVIKILEKIDSGTTEPLIGIIDNKQVIIKILKNTFGRKVIVNEFICLEIAKIIDLPIPNGGLCIINEKTDIESLIDYEISYEDVYGICFYSEKLDKMIEFVDLSPELVNKIENKNDIIRVIIFDHFINNKDRHDGNILLKYATNNKKGIIFNIIDHSHTFNMFKNWIQFEYDKYNEYEVIKENEEVYSNFYSNVNINIDILKKEASIFKERLNKEIIESILNKLPENLIKEEEKDKILNYLLNRLDIIDDICHFISKNINCPGGNNYEYTLFSSNL